MLQVNIYYNVEEIFGVTFKLFNLNSVALDVCVYTFIPANHSGSDNENNTVEISL